MYSDPIVEQTRKLRDEYAARFNYDLDAICQDLMERQRVSDRKLIKRSPKRPIACWRHPGSDLSFRRGIQPRAPPK